MTLTPYTSTPKPLPPLVQSSSVNSASKSNQLATPTNALHVTAANQIAAKTSAPPSKSSKGLASDVTKDSLKRPVSGCPVTQSSTVVPKPASIVPPTSKPLSSLGAKPVTSKRIASVTTPKKLVN